MVSSLRVWVHYCFEILSAAHLPFGHRTMSCFSMIPDEFLKLVMQHVPVKDRLGSCCLVSRRMHAAAVAATAGLELRPVSPESAESALRWVWHYGQHLTSLMFYNSPKPLRELSSRDLRELKLLRCSVQLGAADGQPGVIDGCPNLACLELWCDFVDAPKCAVVDSLSSLCTCSAYCCGQAGKSEWGIG